MKNESPINPDEPVRHVIVSLLMTALPPELQAAAPDLAERVGKHPEVAPHFDKEWGSISESQGNIIAREVSLVARDVIAGAGVVSPSGERCIDGHPDSGKSTDWKAL